MLTNEISAAANFTFCHKIQVKTVLIRCPAFLHQFL